MSHTFYIYTAYGVTGVIMLALIAWVFFDGRARQRELQRLEAAGIRRRSAGQTVATPAEGSRT